MASFFGFQKLLLGFSSLHILQVFSSSILAGLNSLALPIMQCGFAGNPDIYGLGIRLGYYTQALAVWFANYFFYRDAKSLRGANLIFILALLIALCIYAFNAETTYAIEVFLLLQIGLCMGMVSLSSGTRFSSRYMKGWK